MSGDRVGKLLGETRTIQETPRATKPVTVDDAMKAVKDGVKARQKK